MKLFISGGGSGKDSEQVDRLFVNSINKTKPVLYIPIAINTENHSYPECFKWMQEQFQPLEFDNFIMWTENDLKGKTLKDFEQFGGVYIGGGNTFKLLKELREFGTFEIIRKLSQEDIPIYGGSAGAIILARTIISALSADQNDVNLTDFTALNLLQGYDIWCHYIKEMDSQILEYIKNYNIEKIIAIPENTGLFVTKSFVEVIGFSGVKVFEGKSDRIVESGKKI